MPDERRFPTLAAEEADASHAALTIDTAQCGAAGAEPRFPCQSPVQPSAPADAPPNAAAVPNATRVRWWRRGPLCWIGRGLRFTWRYGAIAGARLACLIVLLGVLSAVPLLQLAVLGYLLEVSGRIARGGRVRDSLFLLEQAGRIGMAIGAAVLISLPVRMMAYWAYAADLIEPNNPRGVWLRFGGVAVVLLGFIYLAWAWARGGRMVHYLWPQPIRFIREAWRPATWNAASESLWEFVRSLGVANLLWLGLRGAAGALVWIAVPAILLVGATRNGETGLAGVVGAVGLILMAVVVTYLPLLQVQFAADHRLRSMFAWRRVRAAYLAAPIACWTGTAATLLLAVPLYLLKIEATPKEVVWLPAVFFIAFMLPAHVISGWAIRRATTTEMGRRWWHTLTRLAFRVLTIPVVFVYLVFVYLSQLTSWDGLATWFQQHAFLVPVPFVGV